MSQNQNLSNKPPEEVTQEDLGALRPKEIQLLHFLRHRWRFGEVVIVMDNGVPKGIKRAFEGHWFQ